MPRISSKWNGCAVLLGLVMATAGSADQPKKPLAVWRGTQVIQGVDSYQGPSSAKAYPGEMTYSIVTQFTYIEETDFKTHGKVISHKVSWRAFGKGIWPRIEEITCTGSGQVELVGLSDEAASKALSIPCDTKSLGPRGNALLRMASIGGPPGKINPPKIVGWDTLRDDLSYAEQTHEEQAENEGWGNVWSRTTRYSVHVSIPCAVYNSPRTMFGGHRPGKAGDTVVRPEKSAILPDEQTILHITVTCESQPVPGAEVDVGIEVDNNSGAHAHAGDRPRGKLNGNKISNDVPTIKVQVGADGKADVLFEPGRDNTSSTLGIAGIYHVNAKTRNGAEGNAVVVARVDGLEPLTAGDGYVVVRNGRETHPDGSHGTETTNLAIRNMAADFTAAQHRNNTALVECKKSEWQIFPLSVNDMSLPTGGLFDWAATWAGSHQKHGKGIAADFNHFHACETNADKSCKKNADKEDVPLTVEGCDAEDVRGPLAGWLTLMMLEEGQKYGHWDQYDFSIGMLHLHVNQ